MTIKETKAKSILRKHKKIDSWFISQYGMNLYRGCTHNCIYCDGRAEGYYVEGEFGEDVVVKVNAIEVLSRELDPKRKRTPFKRGFIIVGGGVCDTYQPFEKKYQLTRQTLELIYKYNFPVHILTKSTLVQRDLDIIKKINDKSRAIVSFSFSSVDDKISAVVEPGVPSPTKRLETLAMMKNEGMVCGMFLLPVIPFITDTPDLIEESINKASDIGLDFIIFGGMTLKEGKQKEYFLNKLKNYNSKLTVKYQNLYSGNKWGQATTDYYNSVNQTFYSIINKYKIPRRIPPEFYKDILSEKDLVIVMLEHLDYLLKLKGAESPFGYAAYSLSQTKEPLSAIKGNLQRLKGIGKFTERNILEIINTGRSSYYEKLMME